MTLLERVVALLDRADVPHALIGAAALATAGVARSTFDIDLLVVSDLALRDSTWAALTEASVEIRRGDAEDPLRGVVRIESGAERPVDVIVGKHAWQARAIERAARHGSGPPVVLPRDLVLLKLYAGGTQDTWDVRELLRVCGDRLAQEVEADLVAMPADMRARWNESRAGS
ncbi:MAG TPA: hypothetical protein VF147_04845 [Vicinamibacterales bacterium]